LCLAQRIRLLLVQAVLDRQTVKTALRLVKLLLAVGLAEMENLRLVKMVLLVALAVVVATLTVQAVQERLVKVIMALQLHLQLEVEAARVLLVAYQTAVLEQQIALLAHL
jgi:hypothetical protein